MLTAMFPGTYTTPETSQLLARKWGVRLRSNVLGSVGKIHLVAVSKQNRSRTSVYGMSEFQRPLPYLVQIWVEGLGMLLEIQCIVLYKEILQQILL